MDIIYIVNTMSTPLLISEHRLCDKGIIFVKNADCLIGLQHGIMVPHQWSGGSIAMDDGCSYRGTGVPANSPGLWGQFWRCGVLSFTTDSFGVMMVAAYLSFAFRLRTPKREHFLEKLSTK